MKNFIKNLVKKATDVRGMTLIEIMVVITILGIIAAIIGVNVVGYLEEAKVKATKVQIKNIESALIKYKIDHGYYPSTTDTLRALLAPKKYLASDSLPKDEWGNDFIYYSPGIYGDHDYEIISYGADGKEGGEDENADIKSYELD